MTGRRAIAFAVLLGILAYLATGLRVIQQDERGVARRFGAVRSEPYPPGLHWGLPWGMERVDRVKVDQARTLSVGARDLLAAPLSTAPNASTDDFLTGDLNLVTAQLLVQFRVDDPVKYLFAARSVDATLGALAESSLARALAGRSIDDVLTAGRAEIAERLQRDVQRLADAHGLGVRVSAARLARVTPPAAVAPAFADAARARSDKRQAVTRAEEYHDKALADASGLVREIADRASGRHETLVQSARGEAQRFTQVLAQARAHLPATRERLYLETLAEIMPRFKRTVVVPAGQEVDLSLFTESRPSTTAEDANTP